jgi:hypothetical protein
MIAPTPLLPTQNQDSPTRYRPLAPGGTTPPDDPERADIIWTLNTLAARRPRYMRYHAYLAGEHGLENATKDYKAAFRALLAGLRCNICPRVVHALTDRLKLAGFEGEDVAGAGDGADTGADSPGDTRDDAALAWELWQSGRLDRVENRIVAEAVATGDAYLMVWPDPDDETTPRFYPHSADSVALRYDPERPDRVTLGAKLWAEGKRYRLNLYYPDRTLRYRSERDNPNGVPDAKAFQLLPEEGVQPNRYGRVPFFQFAFDAGMGQCGHAELHDVIPIQDGINKILGDLLLASEFGAYPMRWAVGVDADRDADALQVGIDRLLSLANPDAKLGAFPATDLTAYINTIDSLIGYAAQIKGIPLHTLTMTGQFPSGEALKTAEAPLVARVRDTQTDLGDVWEDALAFGLRIQGTVEDARIVALWQPAESRAEGDQIAMLDTKVTKLGVPQAQAWKELGYDEGEIAEFAAQRDAAAKLATERRAAALRRGSVGTGYRTDATEAAVNDPRLKTGGR